MGLPSGGVQTSMVFRDMISIGIKESGFDYKMVKHDSRVASGMSTRINRQGDLIRRNSYSVTWEGIWQAVKKGMWGTWIKGSVIHLHVKRKTFR